MDFFLFDITGGVFEYQITEPMGPNTTHSKARGPQTRPTWQTRPQKGHAPRACGCSQCSITRSSYSCKLQMSYVSRAAKRDGGFCAGAPRGR